PPRSKGVVRLVSRLSLAPRIMALRICLAVAGGTAAAGGGGAPPPGGAGEERAPGRLMLPPGPFARLSSPQGEGRRPNTPPGGGAARTEEGSLVEIGGRGKRASADGARAGSLASHDVVDDAVVSRSGG